MYKGNCHGRLRNLFEVVLPLFGWAREVAIAIAKDIKVPD